MRFPGASKPFVRNILTLMTGSTVAQALPIAASPVLTRLYEPHDFGVLALFIAIVAVFGSIANGRYELAIMLPDEDSDALNIAALGVLIAVCLSAVLLVIAVFFGESLSRLLGAPEVRPWLYVAPMSVLAMGVFNTLNYLNTRKERYRDIATAAVWKAATTVMIQTIVGLLKWTPGGLLLGQAVSPLAANARLIGNIRGQHKISEELRWGRIVGLSKRYRNFPLFSLPAIFANTSSQQITSVLISTFYSVQSLGHYALVQRVLGAPVASIGSSVGQVFFQRAAVEKRQTGVAVHSFRAAALTLASLSAVGFGIAYVVAEPLFGLLFGQKWVMAGSYLQILVPLFAIRFVVTPLTTVNSLFERQAISMAWQFLLLGATASCTVVCGLLGLPMTTMLTALSITGVVCYATLFVLLFLVSKGRL